MGIDKGYRNSNVTILARCGYMAVHLGESMMRIHDSLAGSKCQLTKEYRNNFFWHGVADRGSDLAPGDFYYITILYTYRLYLFAVGRESETHPAFGKWVRTNFCRNIFPPLFLMARSFSWSR